MTQTRDFSVSVGLTSSVTPYNNNNNDDYKNNKGKNYDEWRILIALATNFIAAFHGLYLPRVQCYSFQFLFSFWVECMKNGLPTMSQQDVIKIDKRFVINIQTKMELYKTSMFSEEISYLCKAKTFFFSRKTSLITKMLHFYEMSQI